jgi:hypothetical protein
MDYMGRVSHIMTGGIHKADVAVFYNAEGEWTGGKNQTFFNICRTLTQGLVDFDIIPYDVLKNAEIKDSKLQINGESYGALIISESEIMPFDRLECFNALAKKGLPIIFTDSLPSRSAEGNDISSLLPNFEVVKNSGLVSNLRTRGLCHVSGEGKELSSLRFYHIARDEKDIYLFSNEAICDTLDVELTLNQTGECLIYDPWDNKLYKSSTRDDKLHLVLEKGNMLIVIFGDEIPNDVPSLTYEQDRIELPLLFDISIMEEEKNEFTQIAKGSKCFDISAPEHMPSFSGSIRYQTSFMATNGYSVIDLGQVGDTCEAWLNGEYLGTRICAPYKFDIKKALQNGENKLEVIVKSNLGHKRREWLSSFIQIPPSGIIGEIYLCKYSKNN